MPLFRTEPEEDGLLAINITLLRSGDPDRFVHVLTFAGSFKACQRSEKLRTSSHQPDLTWYQEGATIVEG
jgi:hypothetical protein